MPMLGSPGAVSGRVTMKGEPARDVTVVLQMQIPVRPPDPEAVLRARTDGEGRYHIDWVAAGRYSIMAFAPGAIMSDAIGFGGPPGKTLYLSEGENVENIDFALKLGGVITGRVTDSQGRPLVDEQVTISRLDREGRLQRFIGFHFSHDMYRTDDRGVYRIYGLPEGQYRVSVGYPQSRGSVAIIRGGAFYPQTFHPDTTYESRSKAIEITEGFEAANIDISVGDAMRTYNVYGRLAHAENGQAVAGVGISYGSFVDGRILSSVSNGERSGANGEFHLAGILPGTYEVFANSQGDNDFVGDPVMFEVRDSDVHGVEVKVRRGSSISGVVVIEGATDLKTTPRLSQNNLHIFAQSIQGPQPHGNVRGLTRVNADGTFHIRGLREGIVEISLAIAHGLALTRVELNGAPQDNGIEIAPGEHITGLKVIVTRATLSLRGEVKIVGISLAPEQRLITSARPVDQTTQIQSSAHVDPRGKFVIENLTPGEYEVGVNILPSPTSGSLDFRLMRDFSMIKQRVNLTGDDQPPITLLVDMSRKGGEPMRQYFSNIGSAVCGVSGGFNVSNAQKGEQTDAPTGRIPGPGRDPNTGRGFEAQTGSRTGTIKGRIVFEDGGGTPNALLSLTSVMSNQRPATARSPADRAITDKEGNFNFAGMAPGVYLINVLGSNEYVRASSPPAESSEQKYCRVGDHVTITLIRGGVITGRVITANGEPMIGVRVHPVRVRDEMGRPVRQQSGGAPRITDDRGVYRLYGLAPGTYVVHTRPELFGSGVSPYEGDVPTYHPSSTRDTATEIAVTSGSEATGVDIRYRGERGHVVSGTVSGLTEPPSFYNNVWVSLTCLSTGNFKSGIGRRPGENNNTFEIHGVPDGEYEIVAGSMDSHISEAFASAPRRVTVRGADLTGIELTLSPMASISGKLVLEAAQIARENRREFTLEEMTLSVRRDTDVGAAADPCGLFQYDCTANDKGEFSIYNLQPARYFIEPGLPDEDWFVKSITSIAPHAESSDVGVEKNTTSTDIARIGMNLKPGEKLTGLILTVADGAASLRGKVVAEKEGERLPSRMRVHLMPAEDASSDDVLRYAETIACGDGSFVLNQIAPDRYLLIARAVPDEEPSDGPPTPVAWDANERAKLRRDALALKNEIELQPRAQVKDYILRVNH